MKVNITAEEIVESIRECLVNGIPNIEYSEHDKEVIQALNRVFEVLNRLDNMSKARKLSRDTKVIQ